MMKMTKLGLTQPKEKIMIAYILIAFVVLVVVLVIVVAARPTDFRVTRSATLPASPETVFAEVSDLHRWNAWSPWARMDPASKNTFEGPASGEGAIMRWVGNNKVGEGSMTITESQPTQLIRVKLEFLKPFQGTNAAEFTFKPSNEGTVVTWSMTGKNNFMMKAVGLFLNCEKMCGSQFEQGLANLKEVVTMETAVTR